jgi:hypothetical protein
MKTTMPKIKKKILNNVSNTGLVLSKNNPYWANDEQIKSIQEAIVMIHAEGEDSPEKRYEISPAQMNSLDNWVEKMKDEYLR